MATYGTLKAGALILTNQTLEVSDLSLGDLRFQNVDTDGTMRLRTSHKTRCLFEFNHIYDKEPTLFEEKLIAGGSASHNSKSYVSMTVTTSGDKVIRQSYQYVPYQIGCNKFVILSATLTTSVTQPVGVRARIGIFDDVADKTVDTSCGNGFFFQLQNNSLQVVKRISTGAETQSDQVVDQPYFSEDVLDGTGPSAVTFVPTKTYDFFIDLTWTGMGVVRMGLLKPSGGIICAHIFNCANSDFCKYANLPVRCEISNLSSVIPDTMRVASGTVWLEGPSLQLPRHFATNIGSQALTISSQRVPVLSIRLKDSFNRATSFITKLTMFSSNEVLWELLLGATLTSSSWQSSSSSKSEYDLSANNLSGGVLVCSSYSINKDTFDLKQSSLNCLYSNMAGVSTVLTLACSKLVDSATIFAGVEWEEIN